MFCNVVVGNLDRGILNYILYMGEIIDKIDWQGLNISFSKLKFLINIYILYSN